jgi:hypothetical protein
MLKKLFARSRPPRAWSSAFGHRGYYFDVRALSVNEGPSVARGDHASSASWLRAVPRGSQSFTCSSAVLVCMRVYGMHK